MNLVDFTSHKCLWNFLLLSLHEKFVHTLGSKVGEWVAVDLPIQFAQGYNDLVLLTETVGLQVNFQNQDFSLFKEIFSSRFLQDASMIFVKVFQWGNKMNFETILLGNLVGAKFLLNKSLVVALCRTMVLSLRKMELDSEVKWNLLASKMVILTSPVLVGLIRYGSYLLDLRCQ